MGWNRVKKLAGIFILAYALWRLMHGVACVPSQSGDTLLINRIWVERMGRDERDLVRGIVLAVFDGEQVGLASRKSSFRFNADVVTWSRQDEELRLDFLQEDVSVRCRVKTWRCEGQAPELFQLCLELRTPMQTHRFYSRDDWVIDPDRGQKVAGPEGFFVPPLSVPAHVSAPPSRREGDPAWLSGD